ncbi:MAG: hypothetical protein HOE90_14735 [Bacteriovoracaceae bacterium]|jgi:hypothetical protein|nr:hypothetical protein [Bacteriovoracaceae bacterium]
MIFGNSNHPVIVKKIRVRVWSLRTELESILNDRIASGEDNILNFDDLKKIYRLKVAEPGTGGAVNPGAVLNLVDEEEAQAPDDDMEAEMAKALEGDGAGAEDDSEGEGGEDLEAEMAGALKEGEGAAASADALVEQLAGDGSFIPRKRPPVAQDELGSGVSFLSDVNMLDICFFSSREFCSGQTVVIEFLIPMYFMVTAEIINCKRYNMKSRIISPTRPDYRVHAKYVFLHQGERTQLRKFVKAIEPDIPKDAPKKPKIQEDDDDLDDLADLGL